MIRTLALLVPALLAAAPSGERPEEPTFQEPQEPTPAELARAKIEAAGALVQRVSQDSEELSVNFAIHGREAGDAILSELKLVPGVVELNLGGTRVTDAGLARIAELSNLRRLYLFKTAVTDAGLAHLSGLGRLSYLNLYGTAVSDAGLEHLAGLTELRRLYLWQTKVSDEGEAKLADALPELRIVRIVDLEPKVWKDPPAGVVPGSCCDLAFQGDEACAHPCCIEATKQGGVCTDCNPPEKLPPPKEPEPERPEGIVPGSCCDQALAKGEACAHPCCVEAAEKGAVCTKCNPPEKLPLPPEEPQPDEPEKPERPEGIVDGGCCDTAFKKGEACAHPCCVEATGKGEVCKKCNPPDDGP